MIRNDKIDYIQFEVNHCTLASRVNFRDYWDLLADKYVFYRELGGFHGLYHIKEYNVFYENHYATNYLLVRKGAHI